MATEAEKLQQRIRLNEQNLLKEAMVMGGFSKADKAAPKTPTKISGMYAGETQKQQAFKKARAGAYVTKGQRKTSGGVRGSGPVQLADITARAGLTAADLTTLRSRLSRTEFLSAAKARQKGVSDDELAKNVGKSLAATAALQGTARLTASTLGSSILRGVGGLGGYLGALGPLASIAGLGFGLYSSYKAKKKEKKQRKKRERAADSYTKKMTADIEGGQRVGEGETFITGGETV